MMNYLATFSRVTRRPDNQLPVLGKRPCFSSSEDGHFTLWRSVGSVRPALRTLLYRIFGSKSDAWERRYGLRSTTQGREDVSLTDSIFRNSFVATVLISCLLGLHCPVAQAQDADDRRTVTERFRSVLPAGGVPVGAMRLYPQLGLGFSWSDNVFANNAFQESDRASTLLAEARLESITSLYSAEVGGRAEVSRFDEFSSNDFENIRFWIKGDKDLPSSNVALDIDVADLSEPRTSVDAAGTALELTTYSRVDFDAAYTYTPGRWIARLDGTYRKFDFNDTETLIGTIDNGDRDRSVNDFGMRLGYEMSELYGLFLEPRYTQVDYDQRIDNSGFERSNKGYEIRLGTNLKYSGVITGELFVGYYNREFDDPAFGTVNGPSFGGEVDWGITRLTTLKLGASRTTDATTIAGASTTINTRFSLGMDHELRRNLLLQLAVETANEDFDGISREDDITRARIGAEYRVSHKLRLKAAYRYSDRTPSPPGTGARNFEINEVTLDVIVQL